MIYPSLPSFISQTRIPRTSDMVKDNHMVSISIFTFPLFFSQKMRNFILTNHEMSMYNKISSKFEKGGRQ